MGKNTLAPALAALVLGITASTSTAAVINFDNLTGGPIFGGDLVTTQYTGLGVTFIDTYSGGAHANNTLTSLIASSSAPNVLWVNQNGGSSTGQYLEIDFSSPVHNISTVFGTSLTANFNLAAYDGTTLLGTTSLSGGTVINDVRSGTAGFSSAQDITSIQLFSNPGSGASFNFEIDNFTFDPVPEPSAMALLGLGIAAFGARVYRRR